MENNITYTEFQVALKIVNDYKSQLRHHFAMVKKASDGISKFSSVTKDTIIYNVDCSVRLYNCLKVYFSSFPAEDLGYSIPLEKTISQLSVVSMSKLLRMRNVGKGTLQELQEICFYAGVQLLP